MYVVTSTIMPATNTKGARIKVASYTYPTKFFPYNYADSAYANQRNAVDDYVAMIFKGHDSSVKNVGQLNDKTQVWDA